jgi:hypothetical protein
MERYRRHFPDAVATDVIAAIALTIPLSRQLADALAGRRSRPGELEGEARLLHPAGTGIFVMCTPREETERMYVKTYLRLDGIEQRRMARGWFLEPTEVLREAFEMGYQAAREADAPPMAVQASEEYLEQLVALAPRLGAPALGTVHEEETSTRVVAVQPVEALDPATVFASSGQRTQRVFQDFVSGHLGFRADVGSWGRLESPKLNRFLEEPHVQDDGVVAAWLEPAGRAAMLYRPDATDEEHKVTIVSVPRRLRMALAGGMILPDPVAEVETERIVPVVDPSVELVWASKLAIRSWGARARREAEAAGVGVIPAGWLGELESVDPVDLRELVPLLGWRLDPLAIYGALRSGEAILLVRRPADVEAATVVRCAVVAS